MYPLTAGAAMYPPSFCVRSTLCTVIVSVHTALAALASGEAAIPVTGDVAILILLGVVALIAVGCARGGPRR